MELRDGSIVTGKNSPLMHAASALVLNAVKKLAGIPDKIPLLSPSIIESVGELKTSVFGARSVSLDLSEVLICLSINAASNPMAHLALEKMKDLRIARSTSPTSRRRRRSGCAVRHQPDDRSQFRQQAPPGDMSKDRMKGSFLQRARSRYRTFKKRHPLRRTAIALGLAGLAYAATSAVLALTGAVPAAPVFPGMDIDNYYAWQIVFIMPLIYAVWILASGVLLALGTRGCHRSDVLVRAARAWGGR